MRSYRFEQFGSLDHLQGVEEAMPVPQAREVLVRVRAISLNYRDLAIVKGHYTLDSKPGHIPFSDAAGEVMAIGERVERFRPGDRVMNTFMPRWFGGDFRASALNELYGANRDGWLTEYKVVSEEALLPIPDYLSYEQAATLPCAAVTAWAALRGDRPLKAGDSVLTLGTGGVSVFAVQLAKAMGIKVIATTSSQEKAQFLTDLGADEVINYRENPEWSRDVRHLTGGRGVDRVVEIGGPGTLKESIASVAVGGEVVLIGFVASGEAGIDFTSLFSSGARTRSLSVGSRDDFEDLSNLLNQHRIVPVIDRLFPFAEAGDALRYFDAGQHKGKVVIHLS